MSVKTISDGGSDPNTPTIEQMRESQRMGSMGKGTASEEYGQMQACFNMGVGEDAKDVTAKVPTNYGVEEPWE